MPNMQGCRDYWDGYNAAKRYIKEYSIDVAWTDYIYGYIGNGSLNYSKGFVSALLMPRDVWRMKVGFGRYNEDLMKVCAALCSDCDCVIITLR